MNACGHAQSLNISFEDGPIEDIAGFLNGIMTEVVSREQHPSHFRVNHAGAMAGFTI